MQHLINYAMRMVGTPYRWGGSNPIQGLDCGALAQEILSAAGIDPPGDQTAQGLYNHFEKISTHNAFSAGALAFYGASVSKVVHVGFMIDPYLMIEAGGGGHLILTKEDAALASAFVRMRPVKHRKDFLCTLKPSYGLIGVI